MHERFNRHAGSSRRGCIFRLFLFILDGLRMVSGTYEEGTYSFQFGFTTPLGDSFTKAQRCPFNRLSGIVPCQILHMGGQIWRQRRYRIELGQNTGISHNID
jgi:hypothetical protein